MYETPAHRHTHTEGESAEVEGADDSLEWRRWMKRDVKRERGRKREKKKKKKERGGNRGKERKMITRVGKQKAKTKDLQHKHTNRHHHLSQLGGPRGCDTRMRRMKYKKEMESGTNTYRG